MVICHANLAVDDINPQLLQQFVVIARVSKLRGKMVKQVVQLEEFSISHVSLDFGSVVTDDQFHPCINSLLIKLPGLRDWLLLFLLASVLVDNTIICERGQFLTRLHESHRQLIAENVDFSENDIESSSLITLHSIVEFFRQSLRNLSLLLDVRIHSDRRQL